MGTEIRTVDFRLNKETRKTLISQRSRISANTTRQAIRTRNENSNKIRNRKREQDSSYSESVFERLQQGKCLTKRAIGEIPSSKTLRRQKPN